MNKEIKIRNLESRIKRLQIANNRLQSENILLNNRLMDMELQLYQAESKDKPAPSHPDTLASNRY